MGVATVAAIYPHLLQKTETRECLSGFGNGEVIFSSVVASQQVRHEWSTALETQKPQP